MNYGRADTGGPTAIGLIRTDRSGPNADRHAGEIRRHAQQLGYRYLYTVRPPAAAADPIGYALVIRTAVEATALVIHDLATVDNLPGRVCDTCDLETVVPPATWAAALPIAAEHTHPTEPLSVAEAHRIMQQHIECRALLCARKSAAVSCLVRAGRLVPPVTTPRERAAARGLRFPPIAPSPCGGGPDPETLHAVLDGLAAPRSLVTRIRRTSR